MSVTFVSGSPVALGTRTNTTITAPSGIQDGDCLLALLLVVAGISVTPPSGFTTMTGFPFLYPNGLDALQAMAFTKRASGESGDYTFSHDSSVSEAYMLAARGAIASGSFEDVNPSINTPPGTTTSITATTITTATDGDLLVYGAYGYGGFSSPSTPSGMTHRLTGTALMAFTEEFPTAGATGDRTSTVSIGDRYAATLIAIKAAAGATGNPWNYYAQQAG